MYFVSIERGVQGREMPGTAVASLLEMKIGPVNV
jgi:hypothetical protein